jgi:hypothetical protein
MTFRQTVRLFSFSVVALAPLPAVAGTVRAVSPSPASASAGQPVTVTVSGTNPCGAANVNWGDGTVITYAITGLPSTHSHAYAGRGRYTIVARGMGNCDGEATASVEVTGPPAPPPTPTPAPPGPAGPAISRVSLSPMPATARQPVTIAVEGRGTCAFVVEYGDGNKQDFNTTLPARVTHTFGAPGAYRVIVGPVAPCTGKFTETLQVQPRGGASIRGMDISPYPAIVGQGVTVNVLGTGTCRYRIDFGDGNNEERSKPLPDAVPHVYSDADTYSVAVTGLAPCSGSVKRPLTVLPPHQP